MNAAAATDTPGDTGALPLVSVVVTCEDPVFLDRTLASLRAQDYPALECVVVDCSTAGEAGASRDGQPVWPLPGAGPAAALAHGLGRVGGEVVGWMQGGDSLAPGVLHAVVEVFRDPAVGLAVSERFALLDADGVGYAVGHNAYRGRERLLRCWETGGTTIHQPGLFVRRQLLDNVGPDLGTDLDTEPADVVAYDLALRVSRHADIAVARGAWANRQWHARPDAAARARPLAAAFGRVSARHAGRWWQPARCRRVFDAVLGGGPAAASVDCAALPPPRFDPDADYRVRDQEPLVTALVCNYNYARYLPAAIDSALAQDYPRLEVLVVDDGSTDASREVLARYGERIRVVLKDNGGQASAFNTGVAEARGEIICLLDSDDLWRPDKVTRVVNKYREAPWGLVCHDLTMIDGDGGPDTPGPDWSAFQGVRLGSGEVFDAVTAAGFAWLFSPTSGMSLPTALAHRIFPLPASEWRISADLPIAYAAISEAPLGQIGASLAGYRLHGANGFSVRLQDPVQGLLIGLVDPARRCLFLRRHLARSGRVLAHSPLQDYRYLRRCCFVAGHSPWRRLPALWRANLRHHLAGEGASGHPHAGLATAKFLLLDTLIALAIGCGAAGRYRRLRAAFRESAAGLDAPTRDFLLNAGAG